MYRKVNHDFFKTWSLEMAYVLGYIAADGAITIGRRGNQYIDIHSIDPELPEMVRGALRSNHLISQVKPKSQNHHTKYRLQIGSKVLVADLAKLGITPRKTKRLVLPSIPRQFLRDFVRGYFDGDGCITYSKFKRTDRKQGFGQYGRVLFTSSSRALLKQLKEELTATINVNRVNLIDKKTYYTLSYYRKEDLNKLFLFFYGHKPKLYLKRKFVYFKEVLKKLQTKILVDR